MEIKKALENYDQKKVDVYIAYLHQLKTEVGKDGKLKNYWYKSVNMSQFIDVCKKVYTFGLEHRTAGFHPDVDNLPPSPEAIVEKVKFIINQNS